MGKVSGLISRKGAPESLGGFRYGVERKESESLGGLRYGVGEGVV